MRKQAISTNKLNAAFIDRIHKYDPEIASTIKGTFDYAKNIPAVSEALKMNLPPGSVDALKEDRFNLVPNPKRANKQQIQEATDKLRSMFNKKAGVVADLLTEQNARQIDMRGQVMARASVLNKQGSAGPIQGGQAGMSKSEGTRPTEVDQKQLKMGIKVEREHSNARGVQREIAMDHLTEIPDYYTRLNKMERQAKAAHIDKLAGIL